MMRSFCLVAALAVLPRQALAYPRVHPESFQGTVGVGLGVTNPTGPAPANMLIEPSVGVMYREGGIQPLNFGAGIRVSGQFDLSYTNGRPSLKADRLALTGDLFWMFFGVELGVVTERDAPGSYNYGPQGSLYLTLARAASVYVRESYIPASDHPWRTDVGLNVQLTPNEWKEVLDMVGQ